MSTGAQGARLRASGESPEKVLSRFPNLAALKRGIALALAGEIGYSGHVSLLDRQPSVYASTFPSEIVTCRLDDGSELRLFCKYSAGHSHTSHGHRGGVGYEATVYDRVLRFARAQTPKFFGAYRDDPAKETWLILDYLADSVRVSKLPDPDAMPLAARWIGRFHAENESRSSRQSLAFLNRYDAAYYLGWVRRTLQFTVAVHGRFPWLPILCERAPEFIRYLLGSPPTVIHGEYYPINVLFHGEGIYPVDWESAAFGAGEIDLAALTDGWGGEVSRTCESAYRQARWPDADPPVDHDRALTAARLYLLFRWLGDRREWTSPGPWGLEQIAAYGEQLGLCQLGPSHETPH